jgi:hypothetical protein
MWCTGLLKTHVPQGFEEDQRFRERVAETEGYRGNQYLTDESRLFRALNPHTHQFTLQQDYADVLWREAGFVTLPHRRW